MQIKNLPKIQEEIKKELSNPQVLNSLIATTFKGLSPESTKQAITEGVMRGFSFNDFLERNVYAIPFKNSYTLVTSIDYARKIGMRSGVVGVGAPIYQDDDNGNIITCSVTVKRLIDGYTAEFTATVYFSEYYKGGGNYPTLWDTKPRTMIAKVAEMHALRKACPEELSQAYAEEEYQANANTTIQTSTTASNLTDEIKQEVDAISTIDELREYYLANKGLGKEFDVYVNKRKKQITESSVA